MVALIDLLDAKKQERTSSKQQLVINTTNGFLYLSPQRKVLYDAIYLNQKGSDISASLQHHGANASFELKNDIFNLRGEHFDDVFMNHLLAIAEHKEGSLYFYMYGSFKEFQGVLKVNDTILKEYKVINNVLAFANTLPALSTFSLPDYSTKGLHVQEAYGGFSYQNKNITILDASLSAKELKLYGNGILNFPNNQIDMKLSLKTDLGSKLSQIPIVGYLLFGEDGSVSTTLTIDGKLDDPTVSNAVAKDIVVAPFQLLKRTLLLPAHLIEQIE
jgi:hypothetical protein